MVSAIAPSRRPLKEAHWWRIWTMILAALTYIFLLFIFDRHRDPDNPDTVDLPPWGVLLLFCAVCLAGAIYCRSRVQRAMRYARTIYGPEALDIRRPWWCQYVRIARRLLAVFALVLFPLITTPRPEVPAVIHAPLWLVVLWFFAVIGIAPLTAALSTQQTNAHRAERAQDLIQDLLRRAGPLHDQLADDLTSAVRQLNDVTAKIRDNEEKVQRFKLEDRSVVMEVLAEILAKENRKGLRQQWFFALIIGFLVGLVVNWISPPALDAIRRIVHL